MLSCHGRALGGGLITVGFPAATGLPMGSDFPAEQDGVA